LHESITNWEVCVSSRSWPVSRHYTSIRLGAEKPAADFSHYSLELFRYFDIDFTDAVLEVEVTLRSDFSL
jgi:hypothetical protein